MDNDDQPNRSGGKQLPVAPPGVVAMRLCATLLSLYALYYARSLIVPLVTGIVLYLTLRPLVRSGRRIGIPDAFGATLVMAALLITIGLGTYLVIDPAKKIVADVPEYTAVVKKRLGTILARVREVDKATEEIAESAEDDGVPVEEKPVPVEIKQPAWSTNVSLVSGTGNLVSFFVICGVLLYFLLAAGDRLLEDVMRGLPNLTSRRRLVAVIENVQEGLGTYLAQVALINLCLGIVVAAAMWLLGMPAPVIWGVMAAVFNFIPIVGAIAGALIIFLVALVHYEPTYYAFAVTSVFVLLTSVEGQLITPAILGRSMKMSPILVFLSIVIWGWMWGMMGVLLSVPILIAVRMVCEQYESLAPLTRILGGTNAATTMGHYNERPSASSTSAM